MSDPNPPSLRTRIAGEHSWLRRRARRLLGPRLRQFEDSQDLAQRVMLKALQHGEDVEFERRGALRAWLGRLLGSTTVDAARRADRRRADALPSRFADDASSPSGHATRRELPQALTRALEALPERERRIVALRVRDDLTFAEIGDYLRLSEAHARQIFRRSLAGLRSRTKAPE